MISFCRFVFRSAASAISFDIWVYPGEIPHIPPRHTPKGLRLKKTLTGASIVFAIEMTILFCERIGAVVAGVY